MGQIVAKEFGRYLIQAIFNILASALNKNYQHNYTSLQIQPPHPNQQTIILNMSYISEEVTSGDGVLKVKYTNIGPQHPENVKWEITEDKDTPHYWKMYHVYGDDTKPAEREIQSSMGWNRVDRAYAMFLASHKQEINEKFEIEEFANKQKEDFWEKLDTSKPNWMEDVKVQIMVEKEIGNAKRKSWRRIEENFMDDLFWWIWEGKQQLIEDYKNGIDSGTFRKGQFKKSWEELVEEFHMDSLKAK